MSDPDPAASPPEAPIGIAEFLESVPPATPKPVAPLRAYVNGGYYLQQPDIQLHCGSELCGGTRSYRCISGSVAFGGTSVNAFLSYACKNCGKSRRTFAVVAIREEGESDGTVVKYGELPAFGPPTSSKVISLIGPDRDSYLKGRQAENRGLGIGAFAYYRRVVENQKNRLLDEIIRVAERTKAPRATIELLSSAKDETQFSRAVEMVKDAIPPTMLIDGHNPLTLLHSALSQGLHAQSDEECLALAGSIRVVLEELAERASTALKDHAELRTALGRLMNG